MFNELREENVLISQQKYEELIRQVEQLRILKNLINANVTLTFLDLKTIVESMEKKEVTEND